jgi:hypothetical protein
MFTTISRTYIEAQLLGAISIAARDLDLNAIVHQFGLTQNTSTKTPEDRKKVLGQLGSMMVHHLQQQGVNVITEQFRQRAEELEKEVQALRAAGATSGGKSNQRTLPVLFSTPKPKATAFKSPTPEDEPSVLEDFSRSREVKGLLASNIPKKKNAASVTAWVKSLKFTREQTEEFHSHLDTLKNFWEALGEDQQDDSIKKLSMEWGLSFTDAGNFQEKELMSLIAAARTLAT